MAIQRLVEPTAPDDPIDEEVKIEISLRPTTFAEYVGQERLKKNLQLAIEAARKRKEPIDHVLLYGPPGLGKTTMAGVIANEMGVGLRVTAGPAIERAGDLASILTNLNDGDILFIDEIHRLSRAIEEILYAAMEDFKLDIVIGKGPAARSVRLDLPKFTVIGATTRTGSLAAPLRDRFGHLYRLEFYTPDDIQKIIMRSAKILNTQINDGAAKILSERSRQTPRIANRILKRVRDFADVNGDGVIDESLTHNALKMLEIDELGLDPADRQMLRAMYENYSDRAVGLTTIAALTGDEATTIEDFYEPYLLQIGFIERTPRGRKITPKAIKHIQKNG
ncbi:Holliday junction branch migration DNA helicase RuvB [Candidatus Saccharibacteria bacterium]|nr:Holliday junction branch migration DNA helicase RuvB [Candidatus Saccharibacteria bacterium]MCL1963112.1 Holliday junction branch migration DNA helicase RuvB [Candidatus Saccharibacteria bacterium]